MLTGNVLEVESRLDGLSSLSILSRGLMRARIHLIVGFSHYKLSVDTQQVDMLVDFMELELCG